LINAIPDITATSEKIGEGGESVGNGGAAASREIELATTFVARAVIAIEKDMDHPPQLRLLRALQGGCGHGHRNLNPYRARVACQSDSIWWRTAPAWE
jgi:hypothetical protein